MLCIFLFYLYKYCDFRDKRRYIPVIITLQRVCMINNKLCSQEMGIMAISLQHQTRQNLNTWRYYNMRVISGQGRSFTRKALQSQSSRIGNKYQLLLTICFYEFNSSINMETIFGVEKYTWIFFCILRLNQHARYIYIHIFKYQDIIRYYNQRSPRYII